jgi:hypothetical protein
MASRVHLPSDVPRLPVRGCRRDRCRCSFVAVDPESKQTVPELVQAGARALRQGNKDLASQVLRRAVSLDERHEPGWLWLSAVVDDEEKVVCLEKALAINPHNERAKAGLALLRQEAAIARPAPPVPAHVVENRHERQIILGQLRQFMGFAINTDARTVRSQGRAFLTKLEELGQRALTSLVPERRLEELQLQWQESVDLLATLDETLQAYQAQDNARAHEPLARAIEDAVRDLTQQQLDRQEALREQLSAGGG